MRLRFGLQGWNLGLEAGIQTLKLGSGLGGWDLGFKTGIWASGWAMKLRLESRGGGEEGEGGGNISAFVKE